jgi:hypothetical protein
MTIGSRPSITGIRDAIGAIDDPEWLDRLSERVLTATSWDDLLAEPKRRRKGEGPLNRA